MVSKGSRMWAGYLVGIARKLSQALGQCIEVEERETMVVEPWHAEEVPMTSVGLQLSSLTGGTAWEDDVDELPLPMQLHRGSDQPAPPLFLTPKGGPLARLTGDEEPDPRPPTPASPFAVPRECPEAEIAVGAEAPPLLVSEGWSGEPALQRVALCEEVPGEPLSQRPRTHLSSCCAPTGDALPSALDMQAAQRQLSCSVSSDCKVLFLVSGVPSTVLLDVQAERLRDLETALVGEEAGSTSRFFLERSWSTVLSEVNLSAVGPERPVARGGTVDPAALAKLGLSHGTSGNSVAVALAAPLIGRNQGGEQRAVGDRSAVPDCYAKLIVGDVSVSGVIMHGYI